MLSPGAKLGPYEIVSPLGAGGMGEVYRARDTRLDREVAIKVLPEHLAKDAQFKQRFEREARTVSSLNHPHICTLYDIGREGEADFLVMEYLEGETVAERLKRGKVAIGELLKIGMEMADALDKAHRQGVVHRDLKPGNIMLTKGGAKLMDFGLAKPAGLAGAAGSGSALLLSAAMTASGQSPMSPITSAGSIVGTIQYMSPEQIEGKEADARSDIFAFGATLYEMATGARAFPGKSQISVASAILEKDPEPISKAQPLAPPAFDRVIAQCLQKNPEDRFQCAHDVGLELKWISQTKVGEPSGLPREGRALPYRLLPWAVVAAAVVLLALLAVLYFRQISAPVRAVRSSIVFPEKVSLVTIGFPSEPALSPDGSRLVIVGDDASGKGGRLWLRPLDSLTAQPLEGTEDATYPFWSPDGRYVGFFAQGKLKKIDISGGPPQTLCDAPGGRGGAWNQEGTIIFSASSLSRVSSAGGAPNVITHFDESRHETSHRWPVFLPDGRHYIYWAGDPFATGSVPGMAPSGRSETANQFGIYLGTLESSERKFLFQADSQAIYAPPGYLLFLRGQTLMAQPFDAVSVKLGGEAFPVAEQVINPAAYRLGLFSASQNGVLVFRTGAGAGSQLVWMDAAGKQIGTVSEPGNHFWPRLSPDGKRLAENVQDPQSGNIDVWLIDLARGVRTRFTFDPAVDSSPIWSPDGTRIVFYSTRRGHADLYIKDASGAGSEELVFESDALKSPTDWSRDDRYIAFTSLDLKGKTGRDIWILPLFGDRKPFPFLQTQFDETGAMFSPDGRWLAYTSNESGKSEVYIAPFTGGPTGVHGPDPRAAAPGGKWQVSQGGGNQPEWSRDGENIFFTVPGGKLMAVEVKAMGATVEIGNPRQVLQANFFLGGAYGHSYEVAPDGKHFVVNVAQQGGGSAPLTLVTNWTAGFKR
jgi:Tol biopolymer transport system component/tRNA A-37 threonylcarbamoyl transferase component Bud32